MDVFDKDERSRVMRAVKGKDTGPELAIRRLLHAAGFRYRLHRNDLPGKPDLVFPGRKAVIFIHGCFWHQHAGCGRSARPASNTAYWHRKLDKNVERDAAIQARLAGLGWRVLIIWECETRNLENTIARATEFLGTCRGESGASK